MPEWRQDPVTGDWALLAPQRALRPHDARSREGGASGTADGCPFCAGHEAQTPPATLVWPQDNRRDWQVRVVPNRYPALTAEAALSAEQDGYFASRAAVGVHEVIVETPDHRRRTSEMSWSDVLAVLRIYRQRLAQLADDGRWRYGLVFRNQGVTAGASLEHLHSQLVACDFVPHRIAEREAAAARHFRETGHCRWCQLLAAERASGERMVWENDGYVAFTAYAARFPYETWILPKRHAAHFAQTEESDLAQLAEIYWQLLARIESLGDEVGYNCVWHTAPFDSSTDQHYHWHVEVLPRLTTPAGFELGSGLMINDVSPELAARRLRAVAPNSGVSSSGENRT